MTILSILFLILAFAITITVHEAAHAWMADRLGDPTAKISGRLTLNPIAHYDKIGTTLLFVTMFLWKLQIVPFPFGWAKPVGFDPYNLKNPRKDAALISASGPAANIILAILLAVVVRLVSLPFSPVYVLGELIKPLIVLNVSLAIFNLVPVNPLDGGKILVGLLNEKDASKAEYFLNRFGIIILFFLIFPTFGGGSLLNSIISPIITLLLKLLLGNQII
jgi:Zn-dependent protease